MRSQCWRWRAQRRSGTWRRIVNQNWRTGQASLAGIGHTTQTHSLSQHTGDKVQAIYEPELGYFPELPWFEVFSVLFIVCHEVCHALVLQQQLDWFAQGGGGWLLPQAKSSFSQEKSEGALHPSFLQVGVQKESLNALQHNLVPVQWTVILFPWQHSIQRPRWG